MTIPAPLTPDRIRRTCDPEQFDFKTTAHVDLLSDSIGQERALEALRFGIGMRRQGYNMFLLGPSGTGKYTTVRQYLEKRVVEEDAPPDWCYVNNFVQPNRPRALRLPAGLGAQLRDDMKTLMEELRESIPAAFKEDAYRARREAIETEYKEVQEKALDELRGAAKEKGFALLQTQVGLGLTPMRDGVALSSEDFAKLPEEDQERIKADMEMLQEELQSVMAQVPAWVTEKRDRVREVNRATTDLALRHSFGKLAKRYQDLPAVREYFGAVQEDILENVEQFLPLAPEMLEGEPEPEGVKETEFRAYKVNLIVDHSGTRGVPVVYEDQPSHLNLHGRIEHLTRHGTHVTDFCLIKPGALHRANGGFLILDAHKVLVQPQAWENLKRTLRAREIRIESLAEAMNLVTTVTIEPESIPLNIKIILVGERMLYYQLSALDPDFDELFKVPVDFEERLDRSRESARLYARMIGTVALQENLRAFDREAVAQVIEHASRLAGDSEKMSTHMASLVDLIRESDFWAGEVDHDVVCRADVQRAIDAWIRRADRVRERSHEEIHRGTVLIDISGVAVGQVNGLSVIGMGSYAFGQPNRITARVRLGKGEVVDIEREVELGGATHSKGVLILAGYLGGRFAADRPLALSASLVFEQSYGGVDGDSASSAELYALLSALADAPVNQSLAVTGSVNQHGQVQAIGGVNEKIEGFYDVCSGAGLTGDQGVLIPASNVKHLMLREDVVDAVRRADFCIYPVETIDQGIEILTGIPAGERDGGGVYPKGSINRRVADRLGELAKKARIYRYDQTGG